MQKISSVQLAYEILEKKSKPLEFAKLWNEVSKITKLSDDHISQFYSDISLDSRFTCLKNNKWDLRSRRKFQDTVVDVDKYDLDTVYNESEEKEEEDDLPIIFDED